jgi:hypothetical protein
MADHIVEISDEFWNIRGSFELAPLLDVGTQMSLVRRPSGRFVLLDSYTPRGPVLDKLLARTDDGRAIEAIVNLHPFHTVHVEAVARRFPHARLYGTCRHVERAPDLAWQPVRSEAPELAALFPELAFTVPPGVDFVPSDPKLHFASVLAFHPASRTLHVDDTLMHVPVPLFGGVVFHPTLSKVLQHRAGAVAEFRAWANALVERCGTVEHLCTAHARALARTPPEGNFGPAVRRALGKVEGKLRAHEQRFG